MISFTLGGLFTAVEDGAASNTTVFLEELKGWDGGAVEYSTVPKLYGGGSYITEEYVPEQDIEASILVDATETDFRAFVGTVAAQMRQLAPLVASRNINGTTTTKEVRIRAVSDVEILSQTQGRFVVKLLQINV